MADPKERGIYSETWVDLVIWTARRKPAEASRLMQLAFHISQGRLLNLPVLSPALILVLEAFVDNDNQDIVGGKTVNSSFKEVIDASVIKTGNYPKTLMAVGNSIERHIFYKDLGGNLLPNRSVLLDTGHLLI